jgi:hypothetical protein
VRKEGQGEKEEGEGVLEYVLHGALLVDLHTGSNPRRKYKSTWRRRRDLGNQFFLCFML